MILWLAVGCESERGVDGVHPLDLNDPVGFQVRAGAFEVVPPVHFPQPAIGAVSVWLSLPNDARVDRVTRDDGASVLGWPPGTTADRIETRGSGADLRVVDVRGTRIDADGRRWHHVFRPVDNDPARALVGVEWPADDPELHAIAVDTFVQRLRDGGVQSGLDAVRSKLDCDGCHRPMRPDNQTPMEHGLVARGTDAAGWFTPSTVLADDVPLERYGARDLNAADPYVTVVCPACAVPRATLAFEGALRAGDGHARAVCASWRALSRHVDLPLEHPCRQEAP